MDFNEYQKQAATTAIYPKFDATEISKFNTELTDEELNFLNMSGLIYTSLGLSNESGEVLGKIKKIIRDNNCAMNVEKRDEIAKELGDVLWYVTNIATELNISLNDIAEKNLEKLFSRKERDVLKGSGDKR